MTKEQAIQIEQDHNVIVDAESEMYTHGGTEDDYGWMAIQKKWIAETKAEH